MALSILDNKAIEPNDEQLANVLGNSINIWNSIKEFVHQQYPDVIEEWNYSGKNYGWGFRLKNKKRVLVYLTPCEGFFKVALVFGGNATNEALNSSVSNELKTIIKEAPVYAEGRGFRIEVNNFDILDDIKILIKIKLEN
jgi:hypothetical protein